MHSVPRDHRSDLIRNRRRHHRAAGDLPHGLEQLRTEDTQNDGWNSPVLAVLLYIPSTLVFFYGYSDEEDDAVGPANYGMITE